VWCVYVCARARMIESDIYSERFLTRRKIQMSQKISDECASLCTRSLMIGENDSVFLLRVNTEKKRNSCDNYIFDNSVI